MARQLTRISAVVFTPERAPNENAYAERFVRSINQSINQECLDRLTAIGIGISGKSCRITLSTTTANEIVKDSPIAHFRSADNRNDKSRVPRRPRLGGLLNFYERTA